MKRILVVDSIYHREALVDRLSFGGMNTHVTRFAERGIEQLATGEYGVLIMEPMEFAAPGHATEIRDLIAAAKLHKVPVVVYSSANGDEFKAMFGIDFSDLERNFVKPADVRTICDYVRQILNPVAVPVTAKQEVAAPRYV